MYIMRSKGSWSVAAARRRFAALLKASVHEPQAVYRRQKVAAVVVSPEVFARLEKPVEQRWATMGGALDEIRRIAREEHYTLRTGKRTTRPNAFVKVLREHSR